MVRVAPDKCNSTKNLPSMCPGAGIAKAAAPSQGQIATVTLLKFTERTVVYRGSTWCSPFSCTHTLTHTLTHSHTLTLTHTTIKITQRGCFMKRDIQKEIIPTNLLLKLPNHLHGID